MLQPPGGQPGGGAKNRQMHYISKDASVNAGPKNHEITIGTGCVLHPFAVLDATHGPLHIGDYCIIEEGAALIVPPPPAGGLTSSSSASAADGTTTGKMVVGSHNRFGSRCRIESSSIGSGNVFYALSSTGMMSTVGSHCILGVGARITHDVVLPSETRVLAGGGVGGQNATIVGAGHWTPRTGEVDAASEREECLRMSRFYRSGQFV